MVAGRLVDERVDISGGGHSLPPPALCALNVDRRVDTPPHPRDGQGIRLVLPRGKTPRGRALSHHPPKSYPEPTPLVERGDHHRTWHRVRDIHPLYVGDAGRTYRAGDPRAGRCRHGGPAHRLAEELGTEPHRGSRRCRSRLGPQFLFTKLELLLSHRFWIRSQIIFRRRPARVLVLPGWEFGERAQRPVDDGSSAHLAGLLQSGLSRGRRSHLPFRNVHDFEQHPASRPGQCDGRWGRPISPWNGLRFLLGHLWEL